MPVLFIGYGVKIERLPNTQKQFMNFIMNSKLSMQLI